MNQVSKFRLTILRVFYFVVCSSFITLSLFDNIWRQDGADFINGLIPSILLAVALLSLAGVLQPLRMIPVLLFSLVWKSIFLAAFVLPSYFEGSIQAFAPALIPMLSGFILTAAVIPWGYTKSQYFSFKPA